MPDVCDLRQHYLSLHNDTPYAGHLEHDRPIILWNRPMVAGPGLESDVNKFVATCDFWQTHRTCDDKAADLLQPLAMTEFRW